MPIIGQVRNVRFDNHGGGRSMTGPWIAELMNDTVGSVPIPIGYSCKSTSQGRAKVHAIARSSNGLKHICQRNREESGRCDIRDVVADMGEASLRSEGKFCRSCEQLMRASLGFQSRQLWVD